VVVGDSARPKITQSQPSNSVNLNPLDETKNFLDETNRGHSPTLGKGGNGVLTNLRMAFHKIRDGEAGRVIPYRLNQVHMGIDEDGDPATTCTVQWDPNRPPPPKSQRAKPKTQDTLHKAINDVGGLPADPAALRKAFYVRHKGNQHTANAAWNRALREAKLVPTGDGRLDYPAGSP
jgi:hypothetical protein